MRIGKFREDREEEIPNTPLEITVTDAQPNSESDNEYSIKIGKFREEEEDESVAEDVAVGTDRPVSMSRVDMMLDDPRMLQSLEAEREAYIEGQKEEVKGEEWYADYESAISDRLGYGVDIEPAGQFTGKQEHYVSIDELAASPTFLTRASKYLSDRKGKEIGNLENYEDKRDFVKQYLEHTRDVAANSMTAAEELNYIRKLDDKGKQEIASLYSLDKNIAGAGTVGGDSIKNALADYFVYAAKDPLNYVGLVGGFAVRQTARLAGQKAMDVLFRSQMPTLVATMGVEGTLNAWDGANRQSAQVELGLKEGFSFADMALDFTLGAATAGAIDAIALKSATRSMSAAERLNAKLGIDPEAAAREAALLAEQRKKARSQFDPELGAKIREDLKRGEQYNLDTGTGTTVSPEINAETLDNVLFAMEEWVASNPEIAAQLRKSGEKEVRISDFVRKAIFGEDVEFTAGLEEALNKAGVSHEDFSQAFRGTIRDAASAMGKMSAFKRKIDGLYEKSPKIAKALDNMYSTEVAGWFTRVRMGAERFDREVRSVLTSTPVTTVRNLLGNTLHLSVDTFSDLMESAIYQTQRAAGIQFGEVAERGAVRPMREVLGDSFAIWGRLFRQADQQEIVKRLLRGEAEIEERLLQTTIDAGDDQMGKRISGVARSLQYFNRVQDGFFRRAIFNNRVDFYLRRSGQGTLEEFLAQNKAVPKDILTRAMEDSLERTFSKQYKPPRSGQPASFDSIAYNFVQAVESAPILATAAIPFPRYTANAVEFLYKHMPLVGVFTGGKDVVRGGITKMSKEGVEVLDESTIRQGREKLARGISGSAMFFAMYQMVKDDPDAGANYIRDGETGELHNITTVGPIAVYKMMAQYVYDYTNDRTPTVTGKDIVEAVTGLNLNTSSDLFNVLEVAKAWSTNETEQLTLSEQDFMKALGFAAGDYVGRLAQPLNTLSDLIDSFDAQEGIVRDVKQLSPDAGFTEAFTNSIRKKIPILKQDLPEFTSPTTDVPLRKESPIKALVSGTRIEPARSAVEEELFKHGFRSWSIAPYMKDKNAADMVKQAFQPLLEMYGEELVSSSRYKQADEATKTKMIQNMLSEVRSEAKESAIDIAIESADLPINEGVNRIQRNMWITIPALDRKLINQYLVENGEPTIEESKDYMYGYGLLDFVKEIR